MKARVEIQIETGDLAAALGLDHEVFDLGYGAVTADQVRALAAASSSIPFLSIRPSGEAPATNSGQQGGP